MRLVVVDSIAAVFRHTFDDYLQRTRVLSCVALNLSRIANGHRLAVRGWGVSEGEYYVGFDDERLKNYDRLQPSKAFMKIFKTNHCNVMA